MMDTAQQIVTQVAQGDFAAVEQRLAGHIKSFLSVVLLLSMPDPVVRQQQLAVVKQQVELVKDPKRLPTAAATDLPLGVPAAYWIDLNAYHLASQYLS